MSIKRSLYRLASWVPIGQERKADIARRLEVRSQTRQGKGWGHDTPESEVRAILRLLPARDAVVFDVGARSGEWTLAALHLAGARISRIVAFEPSEESLERLHNEVGDPRVTIVGAAVSSRTGVAPLFSNEPGSGLASLHRRRLDHFGLVHERVADTTLVTLDQFTDEAGIQRIDFLKLDIEGHELAALQGAERLLGGGRIRALSFEFGGCNIDSRTFFQDFWYLLRGYGFDIFRIMPGARLLPIRGYSEDLETFRTTNYVAARAE